MSEGDLEQMIEANAERCAERFCRLVASVAQKPVRLLSGTTRDRLRLDAEEMLRQALPYLTENAFAADYDLADLVMVYRLTYRDAVPLEHRMPSKLESVALSIAAWLGEMTVHADAESIWVCAKRPQYPRRLEETVYGVLSKP